MTRLAFVDTETTGLGEHHEIWEIGVIIRDLNGDTEYEWQLPVRLCTAEPKALEINRYHERASEAKQLPKAKVAEKFADLTRNAVLVANNPTFDVPRLAKLLRQNGQCPMWHYHPVDVRDMSVGYMLRDLRGREITAQEFSALGEFGRWSGSKVAEALGIRVNPDVEHTALGDARVVRDLWDLVTR